MAQCFAPCGKSGSLSQRCINKPIEGYIHCELHRPKAAKLYIKYKKLTDLIKNINILIINLDSSFVSFLSLKSVGDI